MTLVHLGLVALVALGQGARPAPTSPPGDLEGTAWRAVELAGAPVPSRPEPREPHLVFGAAGRLTGSDGCNHLTGSYAIKGEGISFGEIASTQMACPDSEDISRRFRGALKGTSHWRLAGARLEFYGATGKPLAIFVRRDTAPAPSGPAWP